MKVWTDINNFKAKNPVVTIGSFDGVHLGHIQVLKQLNSIAKKNDGESVVITFSPHPVRVLHPDKEVVMLNTIDEKINLLEKQGVNHLIIIEFTVSFSQMSYAKFVADFLIDKIKMHTILIGYDNKIGKNKEGDYKHVLGLSGKYGFNVEVSKPVIVGDVELSSTKIRELLNSGEVKGAAEFLGYNYFFSGKVVHGQKIGNKLGFPTANILPDESKLIPDMGVYAIKAKVNSRPFIGMLNIGTRPTVNKHLVTKPILEVHLFDFAESIYNQTISFEIICKLRDEKKFSSLDGLRLQLGKDKIEVQNIFGFA